MHIILLAAGLSRRMGEANKLLLTFGDKTILQTTLENIIAANIGKVTVVIGHEPDKVRIFLQHYPNINIIENKNYKQGMTSSIQVGVKFMMDDGRWTMDDGKTIEKDFPSSIVYRPLSISGFMICLGDMPLIQPNEYQQVGEFFKEKWQYDEKLVVQPQFNNIPGNPIVFSNYYKKEILVHTAPEGCRAIIQKHKRHLQKIEMETAHILRDVDTQEDYEKIFDI